MTTIRYKLIFSCREGNPLSWLIRKKQNTPYSHVAILFGKEFFGHDLVLEANYKGVIISAFDVWKNNKNTIIKEKEYIVDKGLMETKLKRTFEHMGEPYGAATLIGIALGTNHGKDGDNSWICSEIAYIFAEEEIGKIDKPQDWITPKDIFDAVY
jgi:hypothetical protein